jgi:ketosteroid isomerase-like protein
MSREDVEVVRQPIACRAHTRRRLDEHLGVLFPRALNLAARAVWRLPPRSRLRQALLRRFVQLTFEASHREDYEAAFGLMHPDCETIFPAKFATVGTETRTRGREARIRFERQWRAEWGEFRFQPEELIDLGDRVLVLGRVKGSGLTSRAPFDIEWADLFTISAGRTIREQPFFSQDEALKAAGLEG